MRGCTGRTTAKKVWRVLISGASDPYLNMAIDEALFECRAAGVGPPTFRLYSWSPPSFSFGRGQDPRAYLDTDRCRKCGVPFVRRMTGGGLLFHSGDISYSISCSLDDFAVPADAGRAYQIVGDFLARAYRALGVETEFACRLPGYGCAIPRTAARPGFCSASWERYDLVASRKKLGGSAQKRRGRFIMQHGSVPLRSSLQEAAPFLKADLSDIKRRACAIDETTRREVPVEEMEELLLQSFRTVFHAEMQTEGLTALEESWVHLLAECKYRTAGWNLHRVWHADAAPEGADVSGILYPLRVFEKRALIRSGSLQRTEPRAADGERNETRVA
jgi:lipoate-protein ligase A